MAVETTPVPSYKRPDAPRVATPHRAERGVTLERCAPNGKALKGDRYLLPGFEEYDFIAVQHAEAQTTTADRLGRLRAPQRAARRPG